jgi:large subunit ribosomal protein L23
VAENNEVLEVRPFGVVLEPYQVIKRPLVTEKNVHKCAKLNQYTFEVNPTATKEEIRNAVATLFDVKVLKVCTQTRRGKQRRYRFRSSTLKDWKKAIITLHPDYRIDFY